MSVGGIKQKIRVMTYNVHSCKGMDSRILPERISEIIEKYSPDVVALQELDVNRKKTGGIDQPLNIANYLRMHCHFQPAIAIEGEHYGIAILSRYPFDIVKADHLSVPQSHFYSIPFLRHFFEPRGIIWASIKVGDTEIYFLNTHLGLRARERKLQVKTVLSDEWIGLMADDTPVIFCGDFNAGPKSSIYKTIKNYFKEVKVNVTPKKFRNTFFSYLPVLEYDHVFYKGNIELKSVIIPKTKLTRTASDHLPVIADFIL